MHTHATGRQALSFPEQRVKWTNALCSTDVQANLRKLIVLYGEQPLPCSCLDALHAVDAAQAVAACCSCRTSAMAACGDFPADRFVW